MSINIELDGDYVLKSNSRSFIIAKYNEVKGEETGEIKKQIQSPKYPSTLSHALKIYKKEKVLNADVESFEDLLEVIIEVDEKIDKISEELGI